MPLISGGGGSVFNGGTITQPLVLHVTDPTLIPFEIRASWNAITNGFFRVSNTDNDGDLLVLNTSADLVKSRHSDGATMASVTDGAGDVALGTSGSVLGFFGSPGANRQTLHSATATPEQIALALEATTLMTGD